MEHVRRRGWKIAAYVMAGVFALCAAVQVNDPDPAPWIALYGATAVVSALFARRGMHWIVPCLLLLVSVGWAGTLVPAAFETGAWGDVFGAWEMRSDGVEIVREVGGLGAVAVWSLMLTILAARRSTLRPFR